MSRPDNPWLARARSLLSDGEWHDLEGVIAEAIKEVPAGRAWRMAEHQRQRWYDRNNKEMPPRAPGELNKAIHVGSRLLVMESIYSAKATIERREVNGVKQIRLRPQDAHERCPTCDGSGKVAKKSEDAWTFS